MSALCDGPMEWVDPDDAYDPSVVCHVCGGRFVSMLPMYCFTAPDFVRPPKPPVASRPH
jgi:hypothetical protein